LGKKNGGAHAMVKNRKWEKIEEWRASSLIGQSIGTVRRLIPQKIHGKGVKDTIVKMEQRKMLVYMQW